MAIFAFFVEWQGYLFAATEYVILTYFNSKEAPFFQLQKNPAKVDNKIA